jgi:hypothetical protein
MVLTDNILYCVRKDIGDHYLIFIYIYYNYIPGNLAPRYDVDEPPQRNQTFNQNNKF